MSLAALPLADVSAAASTPAQETTPETPAVFLIHGLGGTEFDLGLLNKRLKKAGFAIHSLTLPGHGSSPEDLIPVSAEDWMAATTAKYEEVTAQHDTVHILGMCMGALLAVELAKRTQHTKGRLVALAPPVFIDGWATPWYAALRHVVYRMPFLPERMKVEEETPYGIKNEQLRAIIKKKFSRGDSFHYRWVPLACIRQVDRLRGWVMKGLKTILSDTLVIHARDDELTSLRSAKFLIGGIGPLRSRMVVLENSYHMVCVDNDREQVAECVLEFLGDPGKAPG
ncbi:MAG: alpha/beta fold hydrolase [Comamonadaceae bacterium]|nr:MAG: alpha/beta fold hydrolase [Comamonadaceae bacterium]